MKTHSKKVNNKKVKESNFIFSLVENSLEYTGRLTGRTYNEINIILYYFIIPFSWLAMLDMVFEFHYLKIAAFVFCLGFYFGCKDFKSFSDRLFYRSVEFLLYFNRFGGNYFSWSVWICVAVPIVIYVLLFYMILK